MSEMIERIAKAMIETNEQTQGLRFSDLVRKMALTAIQELGEPTAEMLKGGMEVLEASQKMGEPLEAQVGRVWWEMICIAQPAPGSTQEDQDRWDKIFAEAVAEVRAERT